MTIADLMDVLHVHDVNKDLKPSELRIAINHLEAEEQKAREQVIRKLEKYGVLSRNSTKFRNGG